ncbi:uncharacterized protein HD556DRAFT_1446482 [Suillus plorans]|uniref:Uncharacterized protein n=1 Tax=Suillus plorans TaxID=116603 RepID=A0A9P7DEY3_9AGAM|nr:uncharacterized protein HD556DRAFT_1446482 [Suillus plorans]KAG1790130.1 hypothetical protein HD556DRAFT_1446482 [Suillus plorans]
MSGLYGVDDFDANGNFHSINRINWDDPSLYTMQLTRDEIEALTHDIPATNIQTDIPTLPELPPARTPSPQPFGTSSHDDGSWSPTEREVPDTSGEMPKSLREANMSSWAARNPTRAIIRPRTPPPRLTDAQKASRKIKRDQKIERTKRLHDAVAGYLDAQKTQIEALALAHHVTPKQINDIISNHTHYRTSRKSQLIHALIHAKAKEMNADRPTGSRYSMAELREMVITDPETKDLTREQKEAYIAALEEHRERKGVSVWANNQAAARDVVATTDRIVKELDDLRVRTGVYGTLFVVRGHINDTIQSTMHGTDNSEDFWEDVYEHPMADFLRQYEQWACTQDQNLNERDSLEAVRKQVRKMILRGLVSVTGKKDIMMNYSNYETAIVETYGVRLVGWPQGVNFTSPSNIGTVVKAHTAELDARRSAGEVVRTLRKKRSDAGVARKRKVPPTTNKENARSSKRTKVTSTQLRDAPKSAEFVESSNEDE